MSNIKFIFNSVSDTATLTPPSGEVATLPVENLQIAGRAAVLRTTTLTGQTILGDLTSQSYVDGFALANHNFTSQATVRIRIWDAVGQTGNLTYDSGVLHANAPVAWGVFAWGLNPWADSITSTIFALFFDLAVGISFQVDYDDATNPDGHIDIGRMFLGKTFSPGIGADYGMSHEYRDSSTQTRTDGGTLRTEVSQSYKRLSVPLNFVDVADRDTLASAVRQLGKRSEFLVSGYPEDNGQRATDYTFVGKFVELPSIKNTFFKYFNANLVMEES